MRSVGAYGAVGLLASAAPRAIALKGLSDAQARAAIASAGTLVAGLQAVGLVLQPAIPTWVTSPANLDMLYVGDSRANVGVTVTATNAAFKNTGLPAWLRALSGGIFARVAKDYGTGGATIANIVSNTGPVATGYNKTFDQILAAESASTVHVLWGVNQWTLTADDDASCAAALAQAKTDTLSAIQSAYTYQKRIMITDHPCSLLSPSGSSTGMSARRQQLGSDYDDWLKTLPAQYPWVFYTGQYRALAVNATGPTETKAGMLYDGKHSLALGAYTSALAALPTLASLFPATPTFALATAAAPPDAALITNPMLTGASGTTPPTGWTSSTKPAWMTVTYASATDADGNNQLVLVISGTPTSSGFWNPLLQTIPAASIAAGDVLQVGCKIGVDAGSTGISAVSTILTLTDGTPTTTTRVDDDSGGGTLSGQNNVFDAIGSFYAPALTPKSAALLAGSSYTSRQYRCAIYFISGVAVNATIRLGRWTPKKV